MATTATPKSDAWSSRRQLGGLSEEESRDGHPMEQDDDDGIAECEMEECATATAIENEDPDSRDSGISVATTVGSSSCSQGTLITAIDNVLDISGTREPIVRCHQQLQKHPLVSNGSSNREQHTLDDELAAELQDNFDGEETFRLFCDSRSPLRKRQRRLASVQPESGPTDFSFLHQSHSSSTSTANASLTRLKTSSPETNDIPPAARCIHRVHSDSVLEMSRDKSWGSPEAFEHYSLLTVDRPQVPHRAFRSIDANTLVSLLDSMPEEQFNRRFVLIDCRYPYEFDGGHIWYSLNLWQSSAIIELFYPDNEEKFEEVNQRIPIFYCEYSQKRGPNMAMALREHDRNRNESKYPYVDYKEIYLLDRGYRHFFKERQYTRLCYPPSYVPMWDPAFANQRKGFDGHRRVKKRRRQR